MEQRKKFTEHKWFTPEEKLFIRNKSNNVCSHCGKKLSDDFTVEHVIPISKGGSNSLANIVALCYNCNSNKDNYIYHPKDYYKYLLPEYLDELLQNQITYYNEFDWLTPNSVLPEDMREFRIDIIPKSNSLKSHDCRNRVKRVPVVTTSIYLKKAVYSDLDDLYRFYVKYLNSNIIESNTTSITRIAKEKISGWFEDGVIYFLVDRINEIKAIIPVQFVGYFDDYFKYVEEASKSDGVVPYFETPIIQKSDTNYTLVLIKAYTYILSNMAKRLRKTLYYIFQVHRVKLSCIKASDVILFMSDSAIGYDSYNSDNVLEWTIFNAKWSCIDESMLDNIQSIDSIGSFVKSNDEIHYIDKYCNNDVFQLTNFDIDAYKAEMRVFAKNLARQFGYRDRNLPIELIKPSSPSIAVYDKDKYIVMELDINEISLPDSVSSNVSIPSFVKEQVKRNCIKYIEIDGDKIVSKEDAPFIVYLRQINRKKVQCKMKKKYLID